MQPVATKDPPAQAEEMATVELAVLTSHPSFVDGITSHLRRSGLEAHVQRFSSPAGLREGLQGEGFDAVIVDHRAPYLWASRGDTLIGVTAPKIAVASADGRSSVHGRFDRTIDLGDVPRLAVLLATLAERRRSAAAAEEAERARKRAERRMNLLQEIGSTAVMCVSAVGEIESCNGAAELLFGLPEARLIGRPANEALPNCSGFERLEPWALFSEVVRPGRASTSVEIRGFPLPGGGAVLLIEKEGGVKDLALQATRRRLDLLAELFPGAIYILGVDAKTGAPDRLLWMGAGGGSLFGAECESPSAAPPTCLLDQLAPDDAKDFADFCTRAAFSPSVETVEHRVGDRWLRHYGTGVKNQETGFVAVYGLVVDVTEEITARDRTELLSQVIEQAANVVIITDTSGAIEYVNPAFERVTGYSAAEVVGQNPRVLKSGRQSREYYAEMWRTLSAGQPWDTLFENRRKDGSHYMSKATISPLTDRYGVRRYVGIALDVTESERLREEVERLKRHTVTEAGR